MADQIKTKATRPSFRDLKVWQKAMELTGAIYHMTHAFPREEAFGLTSQLRRSAISIASNIAESHGRKSPREFKHFLLIARGSNSELQTQLEVASLLKFAGSLLLGNAQNLSEEVEHMLFALLGRMRNNSS